MKKQDIAVGRCYTMKVSDRIVTVRVDAIREVSGYGPRDRTHTVYSCTNLSTGKACKAESAAKFRREVTQSQAKAIAEHGDAAACLQGDEQRSDPRSTRATSAEATTPTACASNGTAVTPKPKLSATTSAGATASSGEDEQGSDPTQVSATSTMLPTSQSNGHASPSMTRQSSTACPRTTVPVSSPDAADAKPAVSSLSKLLRKAVDAAPAKSKHPPTEEQVAILEAARSLKGTGVLVVEAGAGAGKTTTLTMLEDALGGRGQYTAFNSSLVAESKAKFKRCQCNTTHSLAFRAVGKDYAHRLNGNRVRSHEVARMLGIDDLTVQVDAGEGPKPRLLAAGFLAAQVTGAIRRFCQSADRELTAGHFRYVDGIDFPKDGQRTYENNGKVREYLLPFAVKAWADLSNPKGTLPFTHDYYVKIWQLDKPVISADYILLDEAQDTAPVMLDVLRQNAELGTLVILVGDSAQQIYEWRGACNALAAFPDAPRRFLSQSFRFGPAIAQLANQVLEQLEEKTALRLRGFERIASRVEPVAEPKAILCRTNGAAISHLLQQLGNGKRPFLVGGGSDVISFVEAAQALQQGRPTSHPELACFASWTEVQAYVKEDEGEDLKLMVKLIDDFGAETILGALRNMPAEKDADVTISTAHKSKGREWDAVKLAADFPTLSKCGDADLKLLYVALTRAKLVLDVSECPFFTGKDALPFVIDVKETEGIARPTPSAPPTAPQGFTWAKGKQDREWLVRGPAGRSGETVEVVRRDGSRSKKTLGQIAWEGDGVALYRV